MTQATMHDRLRDALKSHKILADTCFLMHRGIEQFLEHYSEPVNVAWIGRQAGAPSGRHRAV
jgi:hypothetical protein